MKIIVAVPENTLPYKCGERFMICDAEKTDDGIKINHCMDFSKTKDALLGKGEDYTYRLKIKAV